jgi:ketosteroid isomerase-like protein
VSDVDESSLSHGEVADRFFAAIERGDVHAVAALYTEDVTVWHNYDQLNQTKAESLRTLGWIASRFGPLRYVDVRRTEVADGFWQQHVTELTSRGEVFRIPAALRVYCHAGRIVRIEEYVDPAPFARLRTAARIDPEQRSSHPR